MNFSAEESDVWDSTPTQDLFIKKYFATKESSNEVVSKRERKRNKKRSSNVATTSIQSENKFQLKNSNEKLEQNSKKLHVAEIVSSKNSMFDNNASKKDNFKRKKPNICETPQNDDVSSFSKGSENNKSCDLLNKAENYDIQSKQLKKKRKLDNNKVSKILNSKKNTGTSMRNFIITPESIDTDVEVPPEEFKSKHKKKLKTLKISELKQSHEDMPKELQMHKKKKKEKINELLEIKNKSPSNDNKVKTKKLKSAKNILNAKESLQNNKSPLNEVKAKTKKLKGEVTNISDSDANQSFSNDSENSEEDNDIRNELKNSRMFLKIQKLMKMAPHLNPSYCEDSEENVELSSSEEISSEYSEDECSSEDDNEALTEGEKEESVDVSEDSSDNGEEDEGEESVDVLENSSDNDEEDSLVSEESTDNYEKNTESLECNRTTSREVVQSPDTEFHSPTAKKPTTFMEKARSKLASAKFRFLNEKLYTETGGEAYRYFQDNREEFDDYHLGYRQQVSKWPLNPVDEIIKDLQKLKKNAVIADLGCGEAKISRVLSNRTVHSFDLVSKHKCVTACDFSKVPLKDSSVDVAVFCLSLMGVNLVDYLREAYRILKIGGSLKIAEVESRIVDLDLFIENLKTLGFVLEQKNLKNKLFVFLDLTKVKRKKTSKAATLTLRPCMYKKR